MTILTIIIAILMVIIISTNLILATVLKNANELLRIVKLMIKLKQEAMLQNYVDIVNLFEKSH